MFAAAAYQALASMAEIAATQGELKDSQKVQMELRHQTETTKKQTEALDAVNRALQTEIVDRTQAEESLRELSGRLMQAQDEERRRIARELHDTTGQVLAALSMNLAEMQPKASDENSSKFSECVALVSSAALEIRNLSYLLHPPLIEELGLNSAVRGVCRGAYKPEADFRSNTDISKRRRTASGRSRNCSLPYHSGKPCEHSQALG